MLIEFFKCIFVVDAITHAYMVLHKFQFYRSSITNCIAIVPPRPHAFFASNNSPAKDLAYWYHPHTSHKELPILFLHGIGVGLYPYMKFLEELNQERRDEDGQIGVLAVEILPVSSRITSPVLRKEDMCQQIRAILHHHGFEKFILVSHSCICLLITA
jgi:triacylglycerol esterase/lipase EstA (alpha/beta hydrolase family)